MNFVIGPTDAFSLRNQGCAFGEALRAFHDAADAAANGGPRVTLSIAVAFGCPYEGEVHTNGLLRILDRAVDTRPNEILLADTIGVAVPSQIRETIDEVRKVTESIPLRMHFHNTRNTGFANATVAVDSGVFRLDSSIGGIGGCPL